METVTGLPARSLLGQVLRDRGEYAAACEQFRRALACVVTSYPLPAGRQFDIRLELIDACLDDEQFEEARQQIEETRDGMRPHRPPTSPMFANFDVQLGLARTALGHPAEGEAMALDGYERLAARTNLPAYVIARAAELVRRFYATIGDDSAAARWAATRDGLLR